MAVKNYEKQVINNSNLVARSDIIFIEILLLLLCCIGFLLVIILIKYIGTIITFIINTIAYIINFLSNNMWIFWYPLLFLSLLLIAVCIAWKYVNLKHADTNYSPV